MKAKTRSQIAIEIIHTVSETCPKCVITMTALSALLDAIEHLVNNETDLTACPFGGSK